jgi:hypothetical protein
MKRLNPFAVASLVFAMTVMSVGVVVANPVITNGLVAAYPFNGNADDWSGNGNNGVVNGATLTSDRFGNPNSAYSFDGIDDYVDLGPQNFNTALSVSVWVNFERVGGNPQAIVNKYDGDTGPGDVSIDRSFDLYLHNPQGGNQFHWALSEGGVAYSDRSSQTAASVGEWYHLVSTFDSGVAQIYVDGVSEVSWDTGYTSLFASSVNLLVGSQTTDHPNAGAGGIPIDGRIDDVYIYDRALSASEVQTLFSSVPEPSTSLLLTLGFIGMSSFNRRRRASR